MNHRSKFAITGLLVGLLAFMPASIAEARQSAGRVTAGAVKKSIQARLARIALLDRAAHRRAATKVLRAPRSVYRYVTGSRAASELRKGFGRVTHFTSGLRRGRPLSGAAAQKRYGLPQQPSWRLRVVLPKGTPVKAAKVHGGAPGVGEVVTMRPVLPSQAKPTASRLK